MWYLQFSSTCNSAIQLVLAQGIWKYSIFTTIKVFLFGFPSTMQCGWSTGVEKRAMSQDSVFQIWWVPESYSKDRLQCPSSRDVNCVGVLGQETWFEEKLFKLFFYWLPTSTSSTCSEHIGVVIRRLPENQYCVIRNGKSGRRSYLDILTPNICIFLLIHAVFISILNISSAEERNTGYLLELHIECCRNTFTTIYYLMFCSFNVPNDTYRPLLTCSAHKLNFM